MTTPKDPAFILSKNTIELSILDVDVHDDVKAAIGESIKVLCAAAGTTYNESKKKIKEQLLLDENDSLYFYIEIDDATSMFLEVPPQSWKWSAEPAVRKIQ